MKTELINLLNEAKSSNVQLKGDSLTGYHFIGNGFEYYKAKLISICNDHGEHFQEMSINVEECIQESEINLTNHH